MKITPNFDSTEFDVGIPWPNEYAANRIALAHLAQWLRNLAGTTGTITSAGRTPAHNAEVGGAEHSQHMKWEALDVVFRGASLRALANKILSTVEGGTAPKFGQLILYADRGHIHISLPTLGSRNGELRYSFAASPTERLYPFLTRASLDQLPGTPLVGGSPIAVVGALAVGALLWLAFKH